MERKFHTHFFRAKLKVYVVELSRLSQSSRESTDAFLTKFKTMRNRCKLIMPENEYVKMAQRCLDIELHKKFQGLKFCDFYELATVVVECEDFLKKESRRKKSSAWTYYQEVQHEVEVAKLVKNAQPITCPSLSKPKDPGKKLSGSAQQFTFDITKIYYPIKEKFMKLTAGHKIPSKDELSRKDYCKYHDLWSHSTTSCWGLRNLVLECINKGKIEFPDKETMLSAEDPFPPVATVSTVTTDLRTLSNMLRDIEGFAQEWNGDLSHPWFQ